MCYFIVFQKMNVQNEGATDAALAVVFGSRNEYNIHWVKNV